MRPLTFLACLAILAGCKKEIKTKDLSGTSWKKISEVTNGSNSWVYPYIQKCELDNDYEFHPDGAFKVVDVGQVCTPPSGKGSTWRVVSAMVVIGGAQYRVERHSKSELVLRLNGTYTTYHRN